MKCQEAPYFSLAQVSTSWPVPGSCPPNWKERPEKRVIDTQAEHLDQDMVEKMNSIEEVEEYLSKHLIAREGKDCKALGSSSSLQLDQLLVRAVR